MTPEAGVFYREIEEVFLRQSAVKNLRECRSGFIGQVRGEPLHHVLVMD